METSLFLAKLIGLYGLLMSLLWAVGGRAFRERIGDCMSDSGFLILSGIVAVMFGLAIVAGHNVWEANWRVVITVVGYLAVLKGIVILGWPQCLAKPMRLAQSVPCRVFYGVVVAPLAGWLAWIGFAGG